MSGTVTSDTVNTTSSYQLGGTAFDLQTKRAQQQQTELLRLRLRLPKQPAKGALLEARIMEIEKNSDSNKLALYQHRTLHVGSNQ